MRFDTCQMIVDIRMQGCMCTEYKRTHNLPIGPSVLTLSGSGLLSITGSSEVSTGAGSNYPALIIYHNVYKRRKSENLPGAVSSTTTGSEGRSLAVGDKWISLLFSEEARRRGFKALFEKNPNPPGHSLASGSMGDSEGADSSAGAGIGSLGVGSGSGSVSRCEYIVLGKWWRNELSNTYQLDFPGLDR